MATTEWHTNTTVCETLHQSRWTKWWIWGCLLWSTYDRIFCDDRSVLQRQSSWSQRLRSVDELHSGSAAWQHQHVLQDKSYKDSMSKATEIFRSQVQSPVERATFWVEHICRSSTFSWQRLTTVLVPYVGRACLHPRHSPHLHLPALLCWTPSYVIVYRSYTLFKMIVFWRTL